MGFNKPNNPENMKTPGNKCWTSELWKKRGFLFSHGKLEFHALFLFGIRRTSIPRKGGNDNRPAIKITPVIRPAMNLIVTKLLFLAVAVFILPVLSPHQCSFGLDMSPGIVFLMSYLRCNFSHSLAGCCFSVLPAFHWTTWMTSGERLNWAKCPFLDTREGAGKGKGKGGWCFYFLKLWLINVFRLK